MHMHVRVICLVMGGVISIYREYEAVSACLVSVAELLTLLGSILLVDAVVEACTVHLVL